MARLITGEFGEAQAAGPVASEAYYQLGIQFAAGRDVEQDYVVAHKWFNLAALHGDARAKSERAALAAEMTREQVAEAQRQAREWVSNKIN
ncbi:MAG: hypothetical protein HKN60_10860 [Rhizobiales bacterium]|nr:hypothetical protein [Hyphomicrobiales bacterium]